MNLLLKITSPTLISKHHNKHTWKNGTCVIIGDSTILGLNEKPKGD